MTGFDKSQLVKRLARGRGIDLVGVTTVDPPARGARYQTWLERGYAGEMGYLGRHQDVRKNPALLLDGARGIICAAVLYNRPEPAKPTLPPTGRISNYARGADYHRVVREKLELLLDDLRRELAEPFEARVCVDTAPVLERELAERAGLGWVGKNTLLLHRRLGSYVFLGEAVTTLELAPDAPATDHCGTCTRCLEACPTQAFPEPHVLDARRCISYLTIEHRTEIEPALAERLGDWVYGCDVCQQVCPYNSKAPETSHAALAEEQVPAHVPLVDLIRLRSGDYRRLVKGSAARRAHRPMLRRNAIFAARNILAAGLVGSEGAKALRAAVDEAAADDHPLVREAARGAR